MPHPRTTRIQPLRISLQSDGAVGQLRSDVLAVEEPLEIRLHGVPVVVTMRTPGDDLALAAGFLHAEGIIRTPEQIAKMHHGVSPGRPGRGNVVNVIFTTGRPPDLARLKRHFTATSACGLCGKTSIDQIGTLAPRIRSRLRITPALIAALPAKMREAQGLFSSTGGLHAAAIFDAEGHLLVLHEDVGRHNAVDKAIGDLFLKGRLPLDHHILLVSGRASFEIVQKAVMAGVPVVCAVSAPSSLAVQTARSFGVTLVGFLRGETMNVYTHPARIVTSPSRRIGRAGGRR